MPLDVQHPRFAARARLEAGRYGSDPWVVVRELVQNARDARARRIAWTVTAAGEGLVALCCEDDGSGMEWDHARRYLFRLYATSKQAGSHDAGRFGVGFWTVLRCNPRGIGVCSWPASGASWALHLAGDLRTARQSAPPQGPATGTRIVLEVRGDVEETTHAVAAALRRYVRGLSRLPDGAPLALTLNGMPVELRLGLPPPATTFAGAGARGVVSLGARPRVELFSHGLLVRSASVLDEILEADTPGPDLGAADGLAPCALVEAPGLEPLLSRGDVRADRRLEKVVRVARRATQRLIRSKLDRLRPRTLGDRARAVADAVGGTHVLLALAVACGGVLAVFAAFLPRPASEATPRLAAVASPEDPPVLPALPGASVAHRHAPDVPEDASRPRGYRDLRAHYDGPGVHHPEHSAWPLRLRYTPASPALHFAILVRRPFAEQTPAAPSLRPGPRAMCRDACTRVVVDIDADAGPLPVPLPTGHRLDETSVHLGDRPLPVLYDDEGMPFAILPTPDRGTLRYRTAPGPPVRAPRPGAAAETSLSAELRAVAAELEGKGAADAAGAATVWLRRRLGRPLDDAMVARHARAAAAGRDFEATALELHSGDCDVRNALLAKVLARAGIESRLAVGFRGLAGDARPWLHAWVEYRDGPGTAWRVADASEEASQPDGAAPAPASTARSALAFPSGRARRPALLLFLAAVVLTPMLLWWARRPPPVRLDDTHDLPALLHGALAHPEAWSDAPEVFDRRLLPLASGGHESLRRAWLAATEGRLCLASAPHLLARKARRRGLVVLAARASESRTVALSLGAHDLDAWDALLQREHGAAALEAACAALRRRGVHLVARCGTDRLEVFALPASRWRRAERYVAVPQAAPWLRTARALSSSRPAASRLLVADALLEAIGLDALRAAEVLAPLARAALREGTS